VESHIVLKPEVLGSIGFLPITNTLIVSWMVIIILIVAGILAGRKVSLVPSGLQNFFELVLDYGYNTVHEMVGNRTYVIFPVVMTFFLYIITANWIGLFPGFGTIGFNAVEHGETVFVPLFRSINSDLNMTLSLAIVSAVITHIFAIKFTGLKSYLKHWFSINPIFLFVGLLEVVGEFTKVLSLSFRLFGNIFAGEVVLTTVAKIFAFLIPLPFYFLEIIVGFVQASVFMMLTLVFMSILTQKHDDHTDTNH
jgi:F-type H+-transporting ATPase subunit a